MTPPWRFDHLGLVIKRLEKGRERMAALLAIGDWTRPIEDSVNGVKIQFGRDPAGVVYELLEPLDETSPVYESLRSGKAILNHVAYTVPDLAAGAARLSAGGAARVSEPKPAIAYGGAPIQFFVTPLRFVIELIEAPDHRHDYIWKP
ncbi:MAG: VOC family protein [Caulobacteraceae bacterium]|nr:VOC family protein [Caulobacteraceae bacterium]